MSIEAIAKAILAATVFTFLMISIHRYFYFRFFKDTQLNPKIQKLGKLLLWSLPIALVLSLALGRITPFSYGQYLWVLPLTWLGSLFIPFCLLITFDFIRFLFFLFSKARSTKPSDPSRRLFFKRTTAGVAAISGLTYSTKAFIQGRSVPDVVRVEVELANLPKSMDGFTIAQLSDIHIGRPMTASWLEKLVAKTNALQADLVAVTGDFVDGIPENLAWAVQPAKNLKAPHGVYFVTGNHEYYSGAELWIPEFEKLGFDVLRNENREISNGKDSFYLLGVDDFNAARMLPDHGPDLKKALTGVPSEACKVLLAHQPREIHNAASEKIDLQLSGHTHGGQLWPFGYMVPLQQPYIKGLHSHSEHTQIYVSQGSGSWGPPMRIGAKTEITLLTLKVKV